MQDLETRRGDNLRIVPLDQFEEAKELHVLGDLSIPMLTINGRLHLDAFGRYWPMPQPGRLLRRAWTKLIGEIK